MMCRRKLEHVLNADDICCDCSDRVGGIGDWVGVAGQMKDKIAALLFWKGNAFIDISLHKMQQGGAGPGGKTYLGSAQVPGQSEHFALKVVIPILEHNAVYEATANHSGGSGNKDGRTL